MAHEFKKAVNHATRLFVVFRVLFVVYSSVKFAAFGGFWTSRGRILGRVLGVSWCRASPLIKRKDREREESAKCEAIKALRGQLVTIKANKQSRVVMMSTFT